jgi:hypothetical protein
MQQDQFTEEELRGFTEKELRDSAEKELRDFWSNIRFFGSDIEEWLLRNWYPIVAFYLFAFLTMAFLLDRYHPLSQDSQKFLVIIKNPFFLTLNVSIFLCGYIYKQLWQRTFRMTFETALESGIILNNRVSVEKFYKLSEEFSIGMRSPWRFVTSVPMAIAAGLINIATVKDVVRHFKEWPTLGISVSAVLVFWILFAYVSGAVTWSILNAARWMAKISKDHALQIQDGHSDRCCGLQAIGLCCLQSALPLLVIMVLCPVWDIREPVPIYRLFDVTMARPLSYATMCLLFLLACALVFFPVMGLHKRLTKHKKMREKQFREEYEKELTIIRKTLDARNDREVRLASDRLRLVHAIDPIELKLSTWPFNTKSLVKYGLAPILAVFSHQADILVLLKKLFPPG